MRKSAFAYANNKGVETEAVFIFCPPKNITALVCMSEILKNRTGSKAEQAGLCLTL